MAIVSTCREPTSAPVTLVTRPHQIVRAVLVSEAAKFIPKIYKKFAKFPYMQDSRLLIIDPLVFMAYVHSVTVPCA